MLLLDSSGHVSVTWCVGPGLVPSFMPLWIPARSFQKWSVMPAWCCWAAETVYFTTSPWFLCFCCGRVGYVVKSLSHSFVLSVFIVNISDFVVGAMTDLMGNWGWDLIYHMMRVTRADDKMMPDLLWKQKKKTRPFGNNLDLDQV